MNTVFHAIRPYSVLAMALFLLVSLTTSCKKSGGSDPEVDPREQYVGTYAGGISSSLNVGGAEGVAQTGTGTIVITKSANPKEIYIETTMSLGRPTPLNVTAELNGANFTVIDRKTDQVDVLGKSITGNFTATGSFANNQVSMAATTEGLLTGATVRRNESITGTKK